MVYLGIIIGIAFIIGFIYYERNLSHKYEKSKFYKEINVYEISDNEDFGDKLVASFRVERYKIYSPEVSGGYKIEINDKGRNDR